MSYRVLMGDRRILFAFLCGLIVATVEYTPEAIFDLRMTDYSVSKELEGAIFSVEAFSFVAGSLVIGLVLPRWVPHRVTLISALVLFAVAVGLIGPFHSERGLASMVVGLGLMGFLMAFLSVLLMPEMIQACRAAHPHCNHDYAYSLISGIYNAAFGVGQALGAFLGGVMYQLFGFRSTMNICATLIIGFTLSYFYFADGEKVFK